MHSSRRSRESADECLDVDVCASLGSVARNLKFSISLHSLIHGRRALSFLKDEFILLKRAWSDEFRTPDLRVSASETFDALTPKTMMPWPIPIILLLHYLTHYFQIVFLAFYPLSILTFSDSLSLHIFN